MSQEELTARLDTAIQKRDDLAAGVQRITGRLEHARDSLKQVEEEAKKKGIDPKKIDDTIVRLEGMLGKAVTKLEGQLEKAETAMKQFEGDVDETDS